MMVERVATVALKRNSNVMKLWRKWLLLSEKASTQQLCILATKPVPTAIFAPIKEFIILYACLIL